MGIVVDTNVFIDAENARLDLAALPLLQTEQVFIAAITVSELLTGVKLAKTADEHIRRHAYVEKLLTHMPVIAFDTEVARIYAELYAYALSETKRSKVNVHDLQIAATALASDHTVLTSNLDDFIGVPGLRVVSPYESNSVHEAPAAYGSRDR
jgi:tRNA(fMet)-specific endonuclease VapC